jgi:riboflavin kinase/FMN adenylyltransferase
MKVLSDNIFHIDSFLAATVGFFDGVHGGHRFLLSELKRLAQERGLPSAVITFPVHPRVVLQSGFQAKLLNTYEEKIRLLDKTGIDYCIILDFNRSLAEMSACDFIKKLLCGKMNISTLLIGYDHRFGRLRSDGFDKYAKYGAACGMEVVKAAPFTDNGIITSSSKIRNLIHTCDMAGANALLGYNYTIEGRVVEGNRIGCVLGFPTANMDVADRHKLIPAFGSYAVRAIIDGVKHNGMTYIGARPTLNEGTGTSIEVNIFDFCEDIYNKQIAVEFMNYIREDRKFSSLDELKLQLKKDREKALEKLRNKNY